MSRAVRVVILLALFGWTLWGVPDRVQAQRAAVADLAAERGAASAGGALLAQIADLRRLDEVREHVWRVGPGSRCEIDGSPTDYASSVEAVRGRRACEAAHAADPALTAAQIVRVDGDSFLVVPGVVGRRTVTGLRVENLEPEDLSDLSLCAVDPEPPAIPEPPTPPDPIPPVPPVPPEPPPSPTLPPLPGGSELSRLARLADLDVRVEVKGDSVSPAEAERLRTVLSGLEHLGVLDAAAVKDLLDSALPGAPETSLYVSTATVAWWPPIEADIEARTGIPLQVGGEPPRARAVLPGHRLAGVPLWSLPTPETEATVDLFDGGTVLWLLFLTGLFGREVYTWRRAALLERDRQSTRDAILQRLSHELRTPAASVRSLVDVFDIPGISEEERQQFHDLARSEAERLATGIDRLLQAARGDATLRIDPVPLDLAGWAEAVRARWAPRLPGLIVQAAHPSPAKADPERLDEAIDALLDNARKYGGPNVTLTVGPNRIVIEDDGPGIPPKDRARVLQKFERVEGRVNDPGGHGLGLWAVGEVARAHKGRLTIEGPSRFVISLGAP